ncbi:argininosuccinate synthetase [Sorochytrium milnesiophthora]
MAHRKVYLIGADMSPYTVKVRQYLRFKNIPFEDVAASTQIFKTLVVPKAGVALMPTLLDGDTLIQDSSLIIQHLERQYPEPSICPPTPRQHLVSRLVEFIADEWLVLFGFFFRFGIWEEQRDFVKLQMTSFMMPDAPLQKQNEIAEKVMQTAMLPGVNAQGGRLAVRPQLESLFDKLLDALGEHFKVHKYLLSEVGPCEGDFALGGVLAAMMLNDPIPSLRFKLRAPWAALYAERMNGWKNHYSGPGRVVSARIDAQGRVELVRSPTAKELPRWIANDALPDTLDPILQHLNDLMAHLNNTQTALAKLSQKSSSDNDALPRAIGKAPFAMLGQPLGNKVLMPFLQFKWQHITRGIDFATPAAQQVLARIDASGQLAKLVDKCVRQSAEIQLERTPQSGLRFGYDVVAFMADVGQDEDFDAAKQKALAIGAKAVHITNVRERFVEKIVFPAIQANLTYENNYLLGTSLARPIICEAQIKVAQQERCDFVAHGCTGKGNDQVRFELGYYALQPTIKVIAPWRIKEFYTRFPGRQSLLLYAQEKGIPVVQTAAKPWSTDENLFHISYEAGILEDPDVTPPKDMWKMTVDPQDAPSEGATVTIHFVDGVPTQIDNPGQAYSVKDPLGLFEYANKLGCQNGIGRIDIVENRFIGIKSRGCYESPGGTILQAAHRDLEGLTLDREVMKLRDELSFKCAHQLYNGMYYAPETKLMLDTIQQSQKGVTGYVRMFLRQGTITVLGRKSDTSILYNPDLASMDSSLSDAGGWGFNPQDSEGFINILSMRMRLWSQMQKQ